MLKKLLLPGALLLGLLAPTSAFANYVCQTEYYPGQFPKIKLVLTTGASCTGSTFTYWVCDPTAAASTTCGFLRYTVPELLNLQSSLVSAAKTQQFVQQSTTTCSGASCFYSIAFKQ